MINSFDPFNLIRIYVPKANLGPLPPLGAKPPNQPIGSGNTIPLNPGSGGTVVIPDKAPGIDNSNPLGISAWDNLFQNRSTGLDYLVTPFVDVLFIGVVLILLYVFVSGESPQTGITQLTSHIGDAING